MFAERFNTLMNIAEVSNSQLGHAVNMNSSHIGRLRNGVRALPKKHTFLPDICVYLAKHITKDYQLSSLIKITGIDNNALNDTSTMALYLENWLLEQEKGTIVSTKRPPSNFTNLSKITASTLPSNENEKLSEVRQSYYFGNDGKRRAIEQLLLMLLKEEHPQPLLMFSDEDLTWLYEDPYFAARWIKLLEKVVQKGNRIHIIHSTNRNMNEYLEIIANWLPIYMTGMVDSYYYPRLRDGVFQHTMAIAPKTAAITSSSIHQSTDDILTIFVTNKSALATLAHNYEQFLSLCKPLVQVLTTQNRQNFYKIIKHMNIFKGDVSVSSAIPPLFTLPEAYVKPLAEKTGSKTLLSSWEKDNVEFRTALKNHRISLSILEPDIALRWLENLLPPVESLFLGNKIVYNKDLYESQVEQLLSLEKQYENLTVKFRYDIPTNILLYVKEEMGAVLARIDHPKESFICTEKNLVRALWDYLSINS